MEEKNKNILFGFIYSLLLFVIFQTFIGIILNNIVNVLYPQEGQLISMFPSTIGWIISISLSLVLVYLIIHFVTVNKINDFLKPNKIKVISSIILIVLALTPIYLSELGIIKLNYLFKQILTFHSMIFSGFFEFMELIFPIIIYYLVVCVLYKIFKK